MTNLNRYKPHQVAVHTGVTQQHPNDRYPYEVIAVRRKGKELDIISCDDKGAPQENGQVITITWRKNGYYHKKGQTMRSPFYFAGSRSFYQNRDI